MRCAFTVYDVTNCNPLAEFTSLSVHNCMHTIVLYIGCPYGSVSILWFLFVCILRPQRRCISVEGVTELPDHLYVLCTASRPRSDSVSHSSKNILPLDPLAKHHAN